VIVVVKKSETQKKMSKKLTEQVDEIDFSLNDCLLRGRVSAPAVERELPSGDRVVEFRLIISRAERDGVDTLDIAAWSSKCRRSGLSLKAGEWVEVAGSVRRRFWQGPAGLASRWSIEADGITRL
jgi:single-strand DNA-binding protein